MTVELRVISGDPTPEEIAVILAIVGRRAGAPASEVPTSRWVDRERLIPGNWVPGPGAWRASMLPR